MTNMDETLVYLNMPSSATVQTIWLRKVNIRIQWQKRKITVILKIHASGEKQAHLLIFKAEEGKDTEKITANRVCRKRVFVF